MSLCLAIKAFFKAWKNPEEAKKFIEPSCSSSSSSCSSSSHLRLLRDLQESGRLIDFLKEDLSTYNDAQVGAAVRKIHADCAKTLEDLVTIRPLLEEEEGSVIRIAKGYNAQEIKVVGNVKEGSGMIEGVLNHKGWKAHKKSLPKKTVQEESAILCPAEIEVKN